MKTAVHFGAGNIGRGFIGALLSNAGYHVVFADVVEPLINSLNEHKEYEIHVLDIDPPEPLLTIKNVSGVISTNEAAMLDAIKSASIITTAVGPNVLRIISRTVAKGIMARKEAGLGPLNIIACENMAGGSAHLKQHVLGHLKDEADKEYLEENVGFPNCAVDRIVPPFSEGKNNLSVGVESFYEWVVEEPALRGEKPQIEGIKWTDNLLAFLQRKLFTLNCGHATSAYLGYILGYPTVDAALKDKRIEDHVRGAMEESGAALCKKWGFDYDQHRKYISKIVNRFRNPYIKDDVVRVGRDPLRKLGPEDRLVGPAKMCKEYGLPHGNLLVAIAAALCYHNDEDGSAVELKRMIEKNGLDGTVEEVLGFEKGSPDSKEICEEVGKMRELQKEAVKA